MNSESGYTIFACPPSPTRKPSAGFGDTVDGSSPMPQDYLYFMSYARDDLYVQAAAALTEKVDLREFLRFSEKYRQ